MFDPDESLRPVTMKIVTIKFDGGRPEVDLGGMNPTLAAKVMKDACEILESLYSQPLILNNGEVYIDTEDYEVVMFEDDESDE